MFCKQCGAKTEGEEVLCAKCKAEKEPIAAPVMEENPFAAPVETAPAMEENPCAAPVAAAPAQETPVPASAETAPAADENGEVYDRKYKLKNGLIAAILGVVAMTISMVAYFAALGGFLAI